MLLFLRRTVPLLALLAVVLLPTGCGQSTGRVKGKITVGGVPLKRGIIAFLSQVGNKDSYPATIIDGVYETDEIPVGEARIIVYHSTDDPPEGGKGNDLVPAKKGKARNTGLVPAEYHSPDTSGLSINVTSGMNTFDKDL